MTRIALVALVVDDYDEAIRFYTEALGFRLAEDTPRPDGSPLGRRRARRPLARVPPAAGPREEGGPARQGRRPDRRARRVLPVHRRLRPMTTPAWPPRGRDLPGGAPGTSPTARSPSSRTSTATASGTCSSPPPADRPPTFIHPSPPSFNSSPAFSENRRGTAAHAIYAHRHRDPPPPPQGGPPRPPRRRPASGDRRRAGRERRLHAPTTDPDELAALVLTRPPTPVTWCATSPPSSTPTS